MKHWFVLLTYAALGSGCAQTMPPPSLCDMPPGFRTWHGAEVEWSGAVVGGLGHGYTLACDRWRKGVTLDWEDGTQGVEAFEDALARSPEAPGILRIRVTGRLGHADDGATVLQLSRVGSISFEPMTAAEEERFWERLISTPRS